MEAGMIERSESPWSFPIVVVVDKNDGRHLFCVDFRKLNADSRPLAVLCWGRLCLHVIWDYSSSVMLFGLANAPGIFQQLMSVVLGWLESFAMLYLDDILVFSETPKQHFDHLSQMFKQLGVHVLNPKLSKCQF